MKDLKKILGKRIKELRNAKNLSQEQLAELTKFDQRTISSIECGHSFSIKTIETVIKALGIDFTEFFDLKDSEKSDKELIKYIKAKLPILNSRDLKLVYGFVKSL